MVEHPILTLADNQRPQSTAVCTGHDLIKLIYQLFISICGSLSAQYALPSPCIYAEQE